MNLRRLLQPELLLLAALAIEITVFSQTAANFFTVTNALEIVRQSTEIGLLALALTPVILTGGIDLSVGSLLGLCAVVFGKLSRDAHFPTALAALCTLALGALGGRLNALLITRLRLPPLIVTLGTFSLFRGMAEGLTSGSQSYTGFSPGFLFLGQGYLFGIPAQLPLVLAAAAGVWLLVHRTVYGRAFRAIGFAPEGARYAGIPVTSRLTLVYILSGVLSALASLTYVAHLGQAKADVGTGYVQSLAITAVVLGGASIFGGIGSVHGTILGVVLLAVLRNGLILSDQPTELAGILTGALLLLVLTIEALLKKLPSLLQRFRNSPTSP